MTKGISSSHSALANSLRESCHRWLSQDVIPLWLEKGIDPKNGGFFESLSFSGESLDLPRRAMVQARQIYSFLQAAELGYISQSTAKEIIEKATDYLIQNFSKDSGAFSYSLRQASELDLYTQAFCLFGLAQHYKLSGADLSKSRAKKLLQYLRKERQVKSGGFTEIKSEQVLYQSNPHMHMLEAALSWVEFDPQDKDWKNLAQEMVDLCLNHFIDKKTGLLAEHFNSDWSARGLENRFVFEPGHQYEWSWLLGRYQKLCGVDVMNTRMNLFKLSEQHGILQSRHSVYDEVWSDFTPKLKSSRFWPQCERIKAAIQLSVEAPEENVRAQGKKAADEALIALFNYFPKSPSGLWFDRWLEDGSFPMDPPAKASSLYHIIGAMAEYLRAPTQ